MAKVVVAGAGINGVSSAIWLQRAGHEVILIDREGPASGTSSVQKTSQVQALGVGLLS